MRSKTKLRLACHPWQCGALRRTLVLAAGLLLSGALAALPLGSSLSWQGRLSRNGTPANGSVDLEFALYNVASAGTAIDTQVRADVPLSGGRLATRLDFTAVPFELAQRYWLEVRVRDGSSSGAYTALLPRQPITATPYALRSAGVQDGGVDAAALVAGSVWAISIASGSVTAADLAAGAVGSGALANFAVGAPEIMPGAVTRDRIAIGGVTGSELANGSAAGAKLVDASVTQGKLGNSSVSGAKLADAAVTSVNILDGAVIANKVAAAAASTPKFANGSLLQADLAVTIGDITAVNNGLGMTGGATSGSATLGLAPALVQARVAAACPAQHALVGVNVAGIASCEAVAGAQTTATVDSGVQLGLEVAVAVGSGGLPVLAYWDGSNNDVKVARCANRACTSVASINTVDGAATVGRGIALAIGNDGFPVMSYADITGGDLKVAKCIDIACNAAPTISSVDAAAAVLADSTAITIGADGNPVVLYSDATNSALKVAACGNASCSTPATISVVRDFASGAVHAGDIVLAADNRPMFCHGAFVGGLPLVEFAHCSSADCAGGVVDAVIDNQAGLQLESCSLLLTAGGQPMVAYSTAAAIGSLRALTVSACNNASCSTSVVSSLDLDDVTATRIELGADGLANIAYVGAGGLPKLFHCRNRDCTAGSVSALAGASRSGLEVALATGADGVPLVVHRAVAASTQVQATHCGTRSCQ